MREVRLLGGRGEGGFQERIVELIIARLTRLDEHRRIARVPNRPTGQRDTRSLYPQGIEGE